MESNCERAFTVSNVSYSYGQIAALRDITFQIRRGERIALLGANGSGKSTLLRLLAGLGFPETGTISFFEHSVTESRLQEEGFFCEFRRRTGIVFQNPDVQLFNASVFDEVAFGPLQLGLPRAELRHRVEETLSVMGLAALRDRPPHRLSGGEKKRVAIASVLVLDPEVLLLDEPTAGLDSGSTTQIIDLLSSWKNGHKTVIVATHDLDVLEEISDRCCVLKSGRLVAEGDPLRLIHDVRLLEATGLIRPHRHTHGTEQPGPHPHVHRHEGQ